MLINLDLVWAEDNECWNTPHRNLTFWLQLPVHSGTAATSQEQRRRTPTEQQLWVRQQWYGKRIHCATEFHQWDLHSRWGLGSNGFEVTDDKGYEVRAHGHSFGKPVFEEAIIHLHSFYLKFTPTNTHKNQCNVSRTRAKWVSMNAKTQNVQLACWTEKWTLDSSESVRRN